MGCESFQQRSNTRLPESPRLSSGRRSLRVHSLAASSYEEPASPNGGPSCESREMKNPAGFFGESRPFSLSNAAEMAAISTRRLFIRKPWHCGPFLVGRALNTNQLPRYWLLDSSHESAAVFLGCS